MELTGDGCVVTLFTGVGRDLRAFSGLLRGLFRDFKFGLFNNPIPFNNAGEIAPLEIFSDVALIDNLSAVLVLLGLSRLREILLFISGA